MTIYIDPFWAGVAVGAFFAAAFFVGLIIYLGIKSNKEKGR